MKDTILVADDSAASRRLMVNEVRKLGLNFAAAGTVEDAVAKLEAGNIALIIGHLQSNDFVCEPLMELLRRIPAYQSIPTLVALMPLEMERLDSTLNAGYTDYLKIPFSSDELLAKIQKLTEL